MPILKISFIGAGFIARFQVQALALLRIVEVVGVTSRTRAHAEALAEMVQEYGVGDCTVYDTISENRRRALSLKMIRNLQCGLGIAADILVQPYALQPAS